MLRASSRLHESMSGEGRYACKCGFTSARATTFQRHLRSFKDEREEHSIMHAEGSASKSGPDAGAVESLDEAVQGNAAEATTSMIGRLSFVGGFSSLWAASPAQLPEGHERGGDSGPREISGGDAVQSDLRNLRSTHSDDKKLGVAECLSEPNSEGYLEITESLRASGSSPGKSKGAPASWITSSMKRALRREEENADDVVCITDDSDGEVAVGGREGQKASVSVEDIERLVLWQEPLQTTKVFGAGMYILICLRHLVNGVEILQPSSALAVAAICFMIYNSIRPLFRRRSNQQKLSRAAGEKALQERVERLMLRVEVWVAPLLSAAVSLVARRLSAHSSKASRVWLGLCLWLVICLGEMGWVTQSSLALWLWVALFTLPTVYVTCRAAADALVEEGLLFVLSAIKGGQRGTLIAAGGLGLTTFSLVDAKIFIRVSFAGVAAAAVVLYQAHRIRMTAISACKC